MEHPLRLNRRRLIGAAGALSVFGVRADGALEAEGAATLQARLSFEARVRVAAARRVVDDARGRRHLIGIRGGEFAGPRISGEVLPGDVDYALAGPDGITTVTASYGLRATDGTYIHVSSRGLITGTARTLIRTVPGFEVPDGPHDWLGRGLFVGTLDASEAARGRVILRVYEVS